MKNPPLLANQEEAAELQAALLSILDEISPSPTVAVNTLIDAISSMAVYYELSLESLLKGVTLAYMAYAAAEMPTADDTIN